jgi:SAM-dependent methyltransferase
MHSNPSDQILPQWFFDLIGNSFFTAEGEEVKINDIKLYMHNGILRATTLLSQEQKQTKEVFGFKWHKRDTYESEASLNMMNNWCNARYLPATKWFPDRPEGYTVLDAGCGASYTALEYFRPILKQIRYLGVDISDAVSVARERMCEAKANAAFLQCDLLCLPLPTASVDVIFSEGVLHHTDSTRNAVLSLAPLLKSGGLFMFYVYRRKGPIREFTDDYVREKMHDMTPQDGWKAIESISRLGKILGELDVEINIPERIELLDIDAGKINLQKFFYWHVLKCFYRPEYSLDEMNHINFDWFAPKNAFRQSPEEVRAWCDEAGLRIEHEQVEEAGITIIARKI